MQIFKGALPDSGALLDQEERTMRILEVIDEEVNLWRDRKAKEAKHRRGLKDNLKSLFRL